MTLNENPLNTIVVKSPETMNICMYSLCIVVGKLDTMLCVIHYASFRLIITFVFMRRYCIENG